MHRILGAVRQISKSSGTQKYESIFNGCCNGGVYCLFYINTFFNILILYKEIYQLILLWKITKAPIFKISMDYLTTSGASEQQTNSCSLLD